MLTSHGVPYTSAMTLVEDFYKPWEEDIESLEDFLRILDRFFERWIRQQRRTFVWRGMVDASWPLHSSLYRRVMWTRNAASAPAEGDVAVWERRMLQRVHEWGLHHTERGRQSVLSQLATLQHFGAPTRLIDVSLNAFIGLWFAVEDKFEEGNPAYEQSDGRLFAIDVTDRLINDDSQLRWWEDRLRRPWRSLSTRKWSTGVWAWRPPALAPRMAAQHGAFLVGGVPAAVAPPGAAGARRWPKGPEAGSGSWLIDEVRQCTSLALRIHKLQPVAGGVATTGSPAYTMRIKASAKEEIRTRLRALFNYEHRTFFPDYPGFADFGVPELRTRPPD